MKAVILAAGRGSRLEDLTDHINKTFLPIRGKPLIIHNLDQTTAVNEIDGVIIVVHHKATQIISKCGLSHNGKPIEYVIQPVLNGTVGALDCARESIGKDDFLLALGDEYFPESFDQKMVDEIETHTHWDCICGCVYQHNLEKIKRTYSVFYDGESGKIQRIREKPNAVPNCIQGTGRCVFKNSMLDYIDKTPINPVRNQKEFPDMIQCAIDDCKDVTWNLIAKKYWNVNYPLDLYDMLIEEST